jgi:hypothetical protein
MMLLYDASKGPFKRLGVFVRIKLAGLLDETL